MAKFIRVVPCFILLVSYIAVIDSGAPTEARNTWAIQQYMYAKVKRMTFWLVKDATLKLRQADRVQEKYRNMISYELGTIAASIQEKFAHMLETYRKISNLTKHRSNSIAIEKIFNAYHIIKGDFNAIRMERKTYYEVVARHATRNERVKRIRNRLKDFLNKFGQNRRQGVAKKFVPEPSYQFPNTTICPEEVYKRSLRYNKWAEKWNNFIPEVEGVDIDEDAIPKNLN